MNIHSVNLSTIGADQLRDVTGGAPQASVAPPVIRPTTTLPAAVPAAPAALPPPPITMPNMGGPKYSAQWWNLFRARGLGR